MGQNGWQKSEGSPTEVPMFIKDGSLGQYHNLWKNCSSCQCLHGSNTLGRSVTIANTDRQCQNGRSARNRKRVTKKLSIVPALIKDGSVGKYRNLWKKGSSCPRLHRSNILGRSVRIVSTGHGPPNGRSAKIGKEWPKTVYSPSTYKRWWWCTIHTWKMALDQWPYWSKMW